VDLARWDRVVRLPHDEMVFGSGEIHVVTVGGAGVAATGEADDTGPLGWVTVPRTNR
jgi:hypothetical protein